MKKISAILLSLLISFLMITPVYASSNDLEEINMSIYIHEDGSATITEVWKMNAVEGTENYKELSRMGDSYITDYSVSDENGAYTLNPDWDIDDSREEKANQYGIIETDSGYELCYGIGEYGYHTYTMTYTIVNFIHQYSDGQAFYWRLVNESMDPAPEHVSISIQSDITLNNDTADIYAFGFEGRINFEGNGIYATNEQSDGSLGRIRFVNIFIAFDEEYFSGTNNKYDSYTTDEMLSEANEGGDYAIDDMPAWQIFAIIGAIVGVTLLMIGGGALYARHRKKHYFPKSIVFDDQNPLPKKTSVDPFRDIPCRKDIFRFYYVAKMANLADDQELKSGLVSAILLRWMRSGQLTFVKLDGNIFNRNKYEIDFSGEVTCENPLEEKMLEYFRLASGTNQILEAKEFERWCTKNYSKLESWFSKVEMQVKKEMKTDGSCVIEKSESHFLGFKIPKHKTVYTAKFREELYHAAGFKNFLLEFSDIDKKQVQEVHLWEDYLIFASILGLTERVEKELGRLYPEFNQYSHLDYTYTTIATRHFVYAGIRSSSRAHSAAQMRSSGGGGSSSFGGGGGGFSGGGGGGSR